MNRHGQFSVNSDIYITFQIIPGYKGQRSGSSLINRISIFSVVTLAKHVFLYLSMYCSNSNIDKEEGRRYSKQGKGFCSSDSNNDSSSHTSKLYKNYILACTAER